MADTLSIPIFVIALTLLSLFSVIGVLIAALGRVVKKSSILYEIINHIPQGVFWKDRKSAYLGCNRTFAAIAGLENPEQIIGKTDHNLPWEKEQTDHYLYYDRQVMENGRGIYGLLESLTAFDGSLRWHQVDKIPLIDHTGHIWGVLGTYQDVSRLKENEETLIKSLQEKETLLREIHHRIKNNLQIISSLLNLQAQKLMDNESLSAMEDSIARVRSIALIHEMLYGSSNLSQINFPEYVRELISQLVYSFSKKAENVTYHIQSDPLILDIDKSVPLGLIVSECVANCFKHAFPDDRKGHIQITIRQTIDRAVIIVEDDGVGISEDWKKRNDSLGLQLLDVLSQQLEGSFTIESSGGTVVKVSFPNTQKEGP